MYQNVQVFHRGHILPAILFFLKQVRSPVSFFRVSLYVYLLTFFHLEKYSNWQGVGQNVARDIAKGQPGKFDAHKLIGHWFNQILYFDPEAVKSFGYVLRIFIYKLTSKIQDK